MSARMCEIVSDTEHLKLETIKKVLGEQSCIDKYLYILHDKDVKEDGTPKNPHYHVYLHFTNARDFDFIAKWFDLSPSFVNKIKGRFGDALEYAQHINAPDKYQYPASEVTANFDFGKAIEQNQKEKEKRQTITDILSRIDTGEIKKYNITQFVGVNDYVRYGKQIKAAFEYRQQRLEREVNRKMEVVYMYGASGTGKTTYAKMIAEEKGMEVFISSGSNDPFDGYKGQECVILDDLRGSVFPLADLLKILDNNTASTVKARYRNVMLECDMLIITTTKTMKEFYKTVFESNSEEFRQFERRCGSVMKFEKDTVSIWRYEPVKRKYKYITTLPNPVPIKLAERAYDEQQNDENTLKLLGFVEDTAKGFKKAVINDKKEDVEQFNPEDFVEILSEDDYNK